MNEIKQIPGPWSVGGEGKPVAETTVYVQVEDIVFTIAHCDLSYVYFPNKANAKPLAHSANLANARLISAVPELLEALKACTDVLSIFVADGTAAQDSVVGKILKQSTEAIAKATGVK